MPLNIRRNASQTVHVPEWRRFISVNPEDSLPSMPSPRRARHCQKRLAAEGVLREIDLAHLAEFWMMEPEIAFADLSDNAALAEGLLKLKYTLRGNTKGKRHSRPRAAAGDRARSADYDAAIGRRGSVSVDRRLGQGRRDR
jgi:hypothetical protein